jgi:hypothetical protein
MYFSDTPENLKHLRLRSGLSMGRSQRYGIGGVTTCGWDNARDQLFTTPQSHVTHRSTYIIRRSLTRQLQAMTDNGLTRKVYFSWSHGQAFWSPWIGEMKVRRVGEVKSGTILKTAHDRGRDGFCLWPISGKDNHTNCSAAAASIALHALATRRCYIHSQEIGLPREKKPMPALIVTDCRYTKMTFPWSDSGAFCREQRVEIDNR